MERLRSRSIVDQRLLAGGERLRLGDHLGDRDDARLGAEDEVLAGLDLPERAQAEGVGGEHALVGVAGDQRHRALRERPHRLVQVHVEGVQILGQRADLLDDRRHHHLHRLGEAEPVAADQRVDRAVEVLGVRGAGLDRHAEHPRLLAQLLDRVDLAVVAEHREGLDPLEGGPGVGRVAVVAEAADRLEALVAQVRVVLAEDLRRPHHLVDAGRRREGGDVDVELAAPARSAGRRGRGRGWPGRRRGRRAARSGAPPRARSARARSSRRRRPARRGCGSRPARAARGRRAGPSPGPGSARRRRGRRRRRRRASARGRGRRRGPPRPRSCAGCRAARRSRPPRRRRCRRGGASSAGRGWRSAIGSWLGVASLRTEA